MFSELDNNLPFKCTIKTKNQKKFVKKVLFPTNNHILKTLKKKMCFFEKFYFEFF